MKAGLFICLLFLSFTQDLKGQNSILISEKHKLLDIGEGTRFFLDENSEYSVENITEKTFRIQGSSLSAFGTTSATVWAKFRIRNGTNEKLILSLGDPSVDTFELYFKSDDRWICKQSGDNFPLSSREIFTNYYLFDLDLAPGEEKDYYLKARSSEPLVISIQAGSLMGLFEHNQISDTMYGIYFGFMLLVILYNIFLFWGVRDNIYLFYVFYALSLAFTTAYIKGYDHFLFPALSSFLSAYPVLVYAVASIFSMVFSINFLHTRENYPFIHRTLIGFILATLIPILLNTTGFTLLSIILFQILALGGCIVLFVTGIIIYRKGFRAAKFYILAWTTFLAGVAVTILSDNQIIPSNTFTTNSLFIGSALEALLLSFALADKINTYKEAKIKAEQAALEEARKNERLMKEQNKTLEIKVRERTLELELKNLELSKQKEDLKELNALKDKLFSIISHDLRSPLNSLHGIIGLLNKGQNPSDIAPIIDDLKTTISTTRNLLDNVLHWAISNIKGVSGTYVPVNLKEVAMECAELLQYSAKVKNIAVTISIPEDLTFETDINMIRLVLRNLISNAIKFTPENGTISVFSEKRDKEIIISVQDTGLGISKENIDRLFNVKNPFSTRGTLNEKGSGIGLILCKEFLKKNNGNIWVDSKEGEGSCFKFSVPIKSKESVELVTV